MLRGARLVTLAVVETISCAPSRPQAQSLAVERAVPASQTATDLARLEAIRRLPLRDLAPFVGDSRSSVRRVIAQRWSTEPSAEWLDPLARLVEDHDAEVASAAAVGLVRLRTDRAAGEVVRALSDADPARADALLQALENVVGAEGLVVALGAVHDPPKRAALFERIRALADPRCGDSLMAFLEHEPRLHFRTLAAFAMAEVGDLRAVPLLAERLGQDEQEVYGEATEYERVVKQNNNERSVAARLVADLLLMYPDAVDSIRASTEDAMLKWLAETRLPHPNAMRALARMNSERGRTLIRGWANPQIPLPKLGAPPPMADGWIVALPALRYAGAMRDAPSWPVLERALRLRRDPLDMTMDALMKGGLAILGLTLRTVGVGAAQGFAEWGDRKAFGPLLTYVREPRENDQSRREACWALAWVATPDDFGKIVELIEKYGTADPKDRFRKMCLLEALPVHPNALLTPALLGLLQPTAPPEVLHAAARAVGRAGVENATVARLFDLMKEPALEADVALALILGGTTETASRAVRTLAGRPEALEQLHDLWFRSFQYWSREDLDEGRVYRAVDNADAIAQSVVGGAPQLWAKELLGRQFEHLDFDNGPHSITRVVLRYELRRTAEHADRARHDEAVRVLEYMKERGTLLALRDGVL